MANVDFNLYLITDRHQLPQGRTLVETVRGALEGGVRAVQLREKDLPAAELYPLAREMRALTREFDARLLLNDRIDVALAVGADGIHLGGQSLPPAAARALLGPDRLIGVSTHRLFEIHAAADAGADFVTFGPVFATPSKLTYGAPVGLTALAEAVTASPLPLFALGGIKTEHLGALGQAGCRHVAVISAIISVPNPRTETSVFLQLLSK